MAEIKEYRGIENLVYAEVTKDDAENYTTGTVKPLAGVATLSKTTESESESHYYDNIPAITINAAGADEVTIGASAIPLNVLGEITGQDYDEATGMLIEGERVEKYFAIGYLTEKTDGSKVYVWRLKGTFAIPKSDHNTKTSGTDANGQELVYTGISTTHVFKKKNKRAKAVNVDAGLDLVDVSNFFKTVQTPDTVVAKEAA